MLIAVSTHAASVIHLICRGGAAGNTYLNMTSYPDINETEIDYSFAHYKGSSDNVNRDGSHLGPGECSWATAVLQSKYDTLVYYIKPGHTIQSNVVYPLADKKSKTINYSGFATWDADASDPNQAFLPAINGYSQDMDEVTGTILDENMIFNFYVTIDKYNRLVLQYVK
jgi:hypothetical protein